MATEFNIDYCRVLLRRLSAGLPVRQGILQLKLWSPPVHEDSQVAPLPSLLTPSGEKGLVGERKIKCAAGISRADQRLIVGDNNKINKYTINFGQKND